MPKTKIQYNNQIKFNASEQFVNYIRIAMASSEAKEKFGKHPTQTEFIRGIIYQWIRKYTPHIIIDDFEGNVPEILEHKALGRITVTPNKDGKIQLGNSKGSGAKKPQRSK